MMIFSDKWVREIYKDGEASTEPIYTFCGALEKCFDDVSSGWRAKSTRDQYIHMYQDVIFPALPDQDNTPIRDYKKEDYEAAIEKIRTEGYLRNGVRIKYSDSVISTLERLIYYTVYCASIYGICDNVLWDSSYQLDPPSSDSAIVEKTVLKKSLTPKQEKKLAAILMNPDDTSSGEDMALLIMFACGLRNAEACALNYGDLKRLDSHPSVHVFWIYKSVKPKSNELQTSGKTWNMGRIIPVPEKVVNIILKRKERVKYLLKKYTNATKNDDTIDKIPIANSGSLASDTFNVRCSSDDVTAEAQYIFPKAGIQPNVLMVLDRDLSEDKMSEILNEKDPSAYLLRRNFATHLQILGLSVSEIQYLLGQNVDDAYESRNDFVDDDRIYDMAIKMKERPLVNEVSSDEKEMNISVSAKICEKINIKNGEPNTGVTVNISDISPNVTVKVYNNSYDRKYDRTIQIINEYHDRYK